MRAYDSIKAERGREVNLESPDFLEQARQLLSRSIPLEIRMSGSSMSPASASTAGITWGVKRVEKNTSSDSPTAKGNTSSYRVSCTVMVSASTLL